ncbi:efflux RND transporter permease subunit [Brevibacillus sp. SYP-B805]|uniref:efflux RND transporter permease subunit n=1 Tax=Brevibacillus sp. SYP-B805 TaxID=1578199 RepID=UPI0013EE025F|nr:efflux RND transporter permease subunit [Brevibacillus sp. SYP-B805]NGQ97315.1 efflux RND transporter permease subunit [Brevibacillus sp. SYP-B805]
MEKLLHFFLKRKLIIYMFTALIVLAGVGSLLSFKVSFVPKTNLPWTEIRISGGSLPPEEMEEKITDKIEKEIKDIPEIIEYGSTSSTGSVSIWTKAKEGQGTEVKQKLESIVNRLRNDFPKEITHVTVEQASYGDTQLAQIAVTGADPQTMLNLAKTTIKDRIEAVEGVKKVEVQEGVYENKVTVTMQPEKLMAYNVTPQEVIRQLQAADWKQAVGTLENDGFNTVIEIDNSFKTIQQIGEVMIETPRGSVALRQLADIQDVRGQNKDMLTLAKGKPFVTMLISKTEDADVIDTWKRVKAELDKMEAEAGGKYSFTVHFETASFIQTSIRNLSREVALGGFLAVAILIFFLKNWRVTLVIATTLPLSALMTFIAMKIFGYEIDAVSLISLSLSAGLIVDAAIVVLESIYHFRERGVPLREAIIKGSREVLTPVVSSQITMVVVFLPLMLADFGEEYKPIFVTIAFTVTAAITASTLAAIFFVPIIADSFLKRDKKVGHGGEQKGVAAAITRGFQRLLAVALRHRIKTLFVAVLLFAAAIPLTPFIKQGEFLDASEDFIYAKLTLAKGMTLETSREVGLQAEASLYQLPEVKDIALVMTKRDVEMYITLKSKKERSRDKDELTKEINSRLKENKLVDRLQMSFGGQGGSAPVQLQVVGDELPVAEALTKDVENMLSSIPGVTNVRNDFSEGSEKLTLLPKKDVMERMQVDPQMLLAQIGGLIGEQTVAEMTLDGVEFDVTAKYPDDWMKHPDQLSRALITTKTGAQVPLMDLVDWKYSKTPNSLTHENGERVITVSAELAGTDLGTVGRAIQEKMGSLPIPAGYEVKLAGDLKQQSQNLSSGLLVFLGAMAVIYIIMVAQFGRLSHPIIIILSLPMAFVGVVVGLVTTQRTFTLMAIVGVTMLIGIVVSNAILLIDRMNNLRARGYELNEAILEGVKDRVRPVIMTKLTAILGMLPMALAISDGSDFHAPLATVVIFGLVFHTIITLILVPVLYSLFESFFAWRQAKKAARRAAKLAKRGQEKSIPAVE